MHTHTRTLKLNNIKTTLQRGQKLRKQDFSAPGLHLLTTPRQSPCTCLPGWNFWKMPLFGQLVSSHYWKPRATSACTNRSTEC